jgi:hypothetical protein
LNSKRVELCGNRSVNVVVVHLPLADHVHEFDAGEVDGRTPEIFEATSLA